MLYLSAALCILWGLLCLTVSGEANYIVLFRWAVFIPLFIIALNLPDKAVIWHSLIAAGTVQSVIVVMQQTGVVASHNPFFRLTGFMGNPGLMGGFQAVALTACAVCLKERRYATPAGICSIFIIYSIVVSCSRAALLAALSGSALPYGKNISAFFKKHRWGVVVLTVICIAGAAGVYLCRSDSADARLLIWRVSLDIIGDNPVFGIGPGQFRSVYMLYQAAYLAQNPLSGFALVADNAAYPYNEFIRIAVEQGFIGLSAFLLMVYSAARNSSDSGAFAPLVALLLFSCFSYQIDKPATAILFPILFGACGGNPDRKAGKAFVAGSSALLLISAICIYIFRTHTEKEIEKMWSGYDNGAAERLERRLPHIYTDIRFNSVYFNLFRRYEEMRDTSLLDFILPTCENWCDIGNFYHKTGNQELVEAYFREAAYMIPTRLVPKYYLWRLLNEQGREDDAARIAKIIMNQPVKVENTTILHIRQEVRKSL